MDAKNLHKLISLTFDSDPKVRKQAAEKLSNIDDPGAYFALMELSYDKNEEVMAVAKTALEKKRASEPKYMSFGEIFKPQPQQSEEKKSEEPLAMKKTIEPIEQIFEKALGKEKAKKFKERLMPHMLNIKEEGEEYRRKAVQEVLTAYFQELGITDIELHEKVKKATKEIREKPHEEKAKAIEDQKEKIEERSEIDERASSVEYIDAGKVSDESIGKEALEVENDRQFVIDYEGEKIPFNATEKSAFQVAMETFMTTDKEKLAGEQIKAIKQFFNKQVDLAFKIAKDKLSKKDVANITIIKDGMRNIYTEELLVVQNSTKEYMKTKTKKDIYSRIVVKDQSLNEGIIYLFDGRGKQISPGMKIKVMGGRAKFFKFSGETALTVSKSGKIVAEF